MTTLGQVEHFKFLKGKGIIHTAAASALGRMLNRLCQKEKIPLLNIVRREEHVELLKSEGATHVLVTKGEWETEFKKLVQTEGFNVVYDALGGGPITNFIISNLPPNSHYHLYGRLENQPITLVSPSILFFGLNITGFHLFPWWSKADP